MQQEVRTLEDVLLHLLKFPKGVMVQVTYINGNMILSFDNFGGQVVRTYSTPPTKEDFVLMKQMGVKI